MRKLISIFVVGNLVLVSAFSYSYGLGNYKNERGLFIAGVQEVVQEIETYASQTPDCKTDYNEWDYNADRCGVQTYMVSKEISSRKKPYEKMVSESEGQRILIIDTGMADSAIRYPNRILGMYQWGELNWSDNQAELSYVESVATVTMRKGLFHIKRNILGESENFVPSTELSRQLDFSQLERFTGGSDASDVHGDISLNVLADYNPDAQFVLLDTIKFNDTEMLCSEEKVNAYADAVIENISSLIDEFGISYVHLSSGITRSFFARKVDSKCNDLGWYDRYILATKLHKSYARILEQVASKAMLFQASVGSPDYSLMADDGEHSEYYSDCKTIPYRLRSGFLTKNDIHINPRISASGTSYETARNYLSTGQKRNKNCNDIYLNVGWEESFVDFPSFGYAPVLFSADAIGAAPMNFMSTSFINPVALSFVNSKANGQAYFARNVVLEQIRQQAMSNSPSLVSPMLYGDFMVCKDFPAACIGWDQFRYGQ
ncbi:hypothetical protein [Gynuella sunshinyii]|uniref:Uncharacterized protein n=1 Tax=Gynuella sunshinyii YC6258 TaxID=1445510 RepID=A0A0C5VX98_9GAMM|nr:hypothetical protein [Gynuella sunshinyii]AJQ97958.1 hypothetical Protein YC6258_05934 [Gynuella sunshinyii YC6258]